ncbi:MAG: hypothetical protein EXR49_08300 [Dehalococcoidia bacterium]|nr:hypothetical protein [Dehalococcoidia bacterium]
MHRSVSGNTRRTGAVVTASAAGALALAACGGGASGAQLNEHWHAQLTMSVCGETYVEPPFEGGIHSHGDGLAHIHPHAASEAGKNATMRRFFEHTRIKATATSIQIPGERAYQDGSLCSNGQRGTMHFTVNGQASAKGLDYVMKDGDKIGITFGP